MDKHDKKDLACFVLLVLVIIALWGGGTWLALY